MADTIATVRTKYNGKIYEVGETIPDMGSLVIVDREGDRVYFEGVSADEDKLPTTDIGTGSQVFFYDTGVVKKFEAKSATWIEIGEGA